MNKLINFIKNKNGFGLFPLFIFVLIICSILGLKLKSYETSIITTAQDIANQILPLKIEQGKIITPNGINKTFKIKIFPDLPEIQFPFVVNTTIDTLNTNNLTEGFYLTRNALYTVSNNQTKITALSNSLDIPQGDYTTFLKKTFNYTILTITLIILPILFFTFLIINLFYSLTALLIAKTLQRKTSFDFRMRLSSCGIILIYGANYLLNLKGTTLNTFLIFMLIATFQSIFIYKGTPHQP